MATGTLSIRYINNQGGGYADWVQIDAGTSIARFVASRGVQNPQNYLIRVNSKTTAADYILQDQDRVTVTPTKIQGQN